jgi:hypothetical protein
MTIMRLIDRWVKGTVLVAAVLAGLAAHHNHTTKPCGPAEVGGLGMCATVPHIGGAA